MEITHSALHHNKSVNCYLFPGFIFAEAMVWLYCKGIQSIPVQKEVSWPSVWVEVIEIIEISFNFFIHIGYVMMRSLFENWEEKGHTLLENKSDVLQCQRMMGRSWIYIMRKNIEMKLKRINNFWGKRLHSVFIVLSRLLVYIHDSHAEQVYNFQKLVEPSFKFDDWLHSFFVLYRNTNTCM